MEDKTIIQGRLQALADSIEQLGIKKAELVGIKSNVENITTVFIQDLEHKKALEKIEDLQNELTKIYFDLLVNVNVLKKDLE